jgi:hypothetical protein
MRCCLLLALGAFALFAAGSPSPDTLRGKLAIHENAPATVETPDHKTVTLDGDETTLKVLTDRRLNGFQIEAKGKFTAPGKFTIGPSYQHSLLVRQNGKLKMITYWCDVCSIRDYTPGPCRCCQKETILDLRDPDAPEGK